MKFITKITASKTQPLKNVIKASDGINLAYSAFTLDKPTSGMIFLHGGGAHSLAGYTFMAEQLCQKHQIATYLFDIRGHGQSGGERGHTPFKEQVWDDISSAILFLKQNYKNIPIYLGGHSSGAGLVLNYSAWKNQLPVDAYIMVAPEFGYRVPVKHELIKEESPFATVNLLAILANASLGLFGSTRAVTFNYSKEHIEEDGLLPGYTVNMCKAVTPSDPVTALKNLEKPTSIFISEQDELISAKKLAEFLHPILCENTKLSFQTLKTGGHLLILESVHDQIAQYLYQLQMVKDQNIEKEEKESDIIKQVVDSFDNALPSSDYPTVEEQEDKKSLSWFPLKVLACLGLLGATTYGLYKIFAHFSYIDHLTDIALIGDDTSISQIDLD